MIDYRELPTDGTAFEQFVREICLVSELHPQWTGRGSDNGRDLILTEKTAGAIAPFSRKWLVQCKHNAHSGASVGRGAVDSIVDDCAQVGASGYLLACSTQPSAGLSTKLKEIADNPQNDIITSVWDGVYLENRLNEPRCFALGHLFFPNSFAATPWRLYNTGSPNRWTAHYKNFFVHLSSRISGSYPDLGACEYIVERIDGVGPLAEHESIRPRAIYYDDKHEDFTVFLDYLVPCDNEPSLKPSDFNAVLQDGCALHNDGSSWWHRTHWDVVIRHVRPTSDHFDFDHYEFYNPHIGSFQIGICRGKTIGELQENMDRWC